MTELPRRAHPVRTPAGQRRLQFSGESSDGPPQVSQTWVSEASGSGAVFMQKGGYADAQQLTLTQGATKRWPDDEMEHWLARVRASSQGLERPGEGARVMARWSGDGEWHRATVDDIGHTTAGHRGWPYDSGGFTYWVNYVSTRALGHAYEHLAFSTRCVCVFSARRASQRRRATQIDYDDEPEELNASDIKVPRPAPC